MKKTIPLTDHFKLFLEFHIGTILWRFWSVCMHCRIYGPSHSGSPARNISDAAKSQITAPSYHQHLCPNPAILGIMITVCLLLSSAKTREPVAQRIPLWRLYQASSLTFALRNRCYPFPKLLWAHRRSIGTIFLTCDNMLNPLCSFACDWWYCWCDPCD